MDMANTTYERQINSEIAAARAGRRWCITRTPGLIEEGSYPVSVARVRGEPEHTWGSSPIAVFRTRAAAQAAMAAMTDRECRAPGTWPSVWDGLGTEHAYRWIMRGSGVEDFETLDD